MTVRSCQQLPKGKAQSDIRQSALFSAICEFGAILKVVVRSKPCPEIRLGALEFCDFADMFHFDQRLILR
jgi:hypothetical protein